MSQKINWCGVTTTCSSMEGVLRLTHWGVFGLPISLSILIGAFEINDSLGFQVYPTI